MAEEDNEIWILDVTDPVIEKKVAQGYPSLNSVEKLIYCLWVADYSMRNAGDLVAAGDLYTVFQEDGRRAAEELHLSHAAYAFSLPESELEQRYFDLFDDLCSEIRGALCREPH